MEIKALKQQYEAKKSQIKAKLELFRKLSHKEYQKELFFCILTPQSNAKKCWGAVEQIGNLSNFRKDSLIKILKTRTRFHNNKANYLREANDKWHQIAPLLKQIPVKELRNWLADNVKGIGLKEASHFLRNIGKSDNSVAILDRHILRNMKGFGVIEEEKVRGRKDYFEKEAKFLDFAKSVGIPADELDLLFWSNETNEMFK